MNWSREKVIELARQLRREGLLVDSNALHRACCKEDPELPAPGEPGSLVVTITCYEIYNEVKAEAA